MWSAATARFKPKIATNPSRIQRDCEESKCFERHCFVVVVGKRVGTLFFGKVFKPLIEKVMLDWIQELFISDIYNYILQFLQA